METTSESARAWTQACAIFGRAELRAPLGSDVGPRLLGRLLVLAAGELAGVERLDEIPSETTPAERRLLFALTAHLWSGQHPVLEMGPFLGGTTRALALGMLRNPLRAEAARLFTYDRFASYHKPAGLRRQLEPLAQSGALPSALLDAIDASAGFRAVFDALHRGTDYAALVSAATAELPDSRAQEATLATPLVLPESCEFGCVLVDGCKSWYATKAFLRQVAPRIPRGAHLAFQDYGWFTCFWIPAFAHGLRDCLELVAHVDATYVFQLVRPLDAGRIERDFPDDPADLGVTGILGLFGELQAQACARSDVEARVFYSLQEIAALRAIGASQMAAVQLERLRATHWTGRPSALIGAAERAFGLGTPGPVAPVPVREDEGRA